MTTDSVFDHEVSLPDDDLTCKAQGLVGFEGRYQRVQRQLQLLLRLDELSDWGKRHHGRKDLPLCHLIAEQYPLVIFYGDVGTGKTATAECIANRLATEARVEDSILFKLGNRVRGSGKVGEMGTLLTEAFKRIVASAGKNRRAILVIDEGDSLAAKRSQEHSHHEDKVAVNTLIQSIDNLRKLGGRVVTILCTNRLSVVDPAVRRRAAVVEEFTRPTADERQQLFEADLAGLDLSVAQLTGLIEQTGPQGKRPGWTYSDLRARLYPAALARAFPDRGLTYEDLRLSAQTIEPTPVLEDK